MKIPYFRAHIEDLTSQAVALRYFKLSIINFFESKEILSHFMENTPLLSLVLVFGLFGRSSARKLCFLLEHVYFLVRLFLHD